MRDNEVMLSGLLRRLLPLQTPSPFLPEEGLQSLAAAVGRGFTAKPVGADSIVKSNIVNNLCKDMVYTFRLQINAFGRRTERSEERLPNAVRIKVAIFFDVKACLYVRQILRFRSCDSMQ